MKLFVEWQQRNGKFVAQCHLSCKFFKFSDTCGQLVCDQKKLPNVYESCPKMISLDKLKILTPLQKLPKDAGDLGNMIVAKGFKKLPKVQ